VGPLNAQESKLINVRDPLEHRVLVESRKNPGGLVYLIKNPTEAIAFLADRSSVFKSAFARVLDRASGKAPLLGAGVGGAVGEEKQRALREAVDK